MRNICKEPDCPAPKGICKVHLTAEYPKCDHWIKTLAEGTKTDGPKAKKGSVSLPWTGAAFVPDDIALVSQGGPPWIVGLIGAPDSGKTSFLGMLYTLLCNGSRFEEWSFAGSRTFAGWEILAQYLKIREGRPSFAPPTPSNPDYYNLLHLTLKQKTSTRDVLFADSSGEVFKLWSENTNDENAENARWIYAHSNAFLLVVDVGALVERKAQACMEIIQLAEQLAANLDNRPVVVIWTKSDRIDEVRPNIREKVENHLAQILPTARKFEVSNLRKGKPEAQWHANNLSAVDALLQTLHQPHAFRLDPQAWIATTDSFFNYKGIWMNATKS